jgi:hypothetical protein
MKKKKLRYRIIRIKRIFSGVYWCITWTKSLTNLHKSLICLWVNWYRLYINKLRKNAFIPIINTGHKYLGILEYTCINTGHKYLGILEYTCINTGHKYLGILEYTCINTGHKYLGVLEYTCINTGHKYLGVLEYTYKYRTQILRYTRIHVYKYRTQMLRYTRIHVYKYRTQILRYTRIHVYFDKLWHTDMTDTKKQRVHWQFTKKLFSSWLGLESMTGLHKRQLNLSLN